CVQVGESKLSLNATGPKVRYLNLPTTYMLTVTNPGTAATSNVSLTAKLPAQTIFESATGGGQLAGNQVQWTLGSLPPGASRTVQLVVKAQAAGEHCLDFTATAQRGLTAQAQACTTFRGESAIRLRVADYDDPVEVGGDLLYRITVENSGQVPVTNVTVEADVPPEMTVTRVRANVNHLKKEPTPQGTKVVFNAYKEIKPGATEVLEIFVRAQKAGDARFKVKLEADQLKEGGPIQE